MRAPDSLCNPRCATLGAILPHCDERLAEFALLTCGFPESV
jgi:hypothetical protein